MWVQFVFIICNITYNTKILKCLIDVRFPNHVGIDNEQKIVNKRRETTSTLHPYVAKSRSILCRRLTAKKSLKIKNIPNKLKF